MIAALRRIFSDEDVSDDPVMLYAYSSDVSELEATAEAVVRPTSSGQVRQLVKLALERGLPLVPRGAGTGASGAVVPLEGGVVVDFSKMNRVLRVDTSERTAWVEPGVVADDLNRRLARIGFQLPVTPGSSAMATVGGMVGNDASGRKTIKYGTTKDWVRNLEVVFADEDATRTYLGRRVLKSVAGYDLVRLLVGSEGTLGLVTQVAFKIAPLPRHARVVQAVYDSLESAGETVAAIHRSWVTPSSVEILDRSSILAVKAYRPRVDLPVDAEAVLLVELEGDHQASVAEASSAIERLCRQAGAIDALVSTTPEENERVWEARALVGAAANQVRPGHVRVYVGEDVVVPIRKIPDTLRHLRFLSEKYGLPVVVFGHVGDGNLHPAVTVRKTSEDDREKLDALESEIHQFVLSLGGSTTGEHGVGRTRKRYVESELGPAFGVMRKIKRALDPKNVLNPGVIF